MAKLFLYRAVLILIILSMGKLPMYGNPGNPKYLKRTVYPILQMISPNDTVPTAKTVVPEAPKDKNPVDAIKEVPKSRKQTAPIAVP